MVRGQWTVSPGREAGVWFGNWRMWNGEWNEPTLPPQWPLPCFLEFFDRQINNMVRVICMGIDNLHTL